MAGAHLINSTVTGSYSDKAFGGCPMGGIELHVAIIAVLIVGSYVWIHHWSRRNMPGPKCWPIVGSVPVLLRNWDKLNDFLLHYFELGHDAFHVSFAFGLNGIYIGEPGLVEYVLKTNFANYPKGYVIVKHMEELLGKGIFNSDDESWKMQRKVASFEFSSSNLRQFSTAVYKDRAISLVRIISELAQSNRCINLQDLLMRMTLDSTAKLGFGVELACLSPSLPEVPFARAFDRANELSFHRYIDPLWNLKRFLDIGEEKELKDCLKVMDSFSYDVISKRREEMQALKILGDVKMKPDLLSRFMSLTTESNEIYSDQALRDVILNFIIAGRDTTGLTLSWFIYNLCLHPEVGEKILKEIQTLEHEDNSPNLEEKSGDCYTRFSELLTYQDLGKLQYLHAALTETMRLHPAVPMDGKTAAADDILPNGTPVKKGNMVTYCSYSMGRLERIWGPDAKEFKPERWLKNGVFQPESPFKFVTFHAGQRTCLGKDSAYLQMKMTAALLVRFFTFKLVPDQEVKYRTMFVLTMNALKVTASPR